MERHNGDLPFRAVTRIVVHPDDPGTVYVTFSGLFWKDREAHVFRSRDMGASWEDVSGSGPGALPDIPVNAFAIDPEFPTRLFAGTDVGVFMSVDEGSSWQPLQEGMPLVTVTDLEVNNLDRFLIAATFGRGAWTLPLDALPTTTEAGVEKPEAFLLESAFPNPFTDAVRVTWSQPATADVEIEIANVAGQRVMQHTLPMVPAGPQEWTWRPQESLRDLSDARHLQRKDGHPISGSRALMREERTVRRFSTNPYIGLGTE